MSISNSKTEKIKHIFDIPLSHLRRPGVPPGSLPGLHPVVFVQTPNSLSQ